ncbi:Bgt-20697, partial [Blumeria graminis f. sp. tritici]
DLEEFSRCVKQWVRHGSLSSQTEIENYTMDLIQVLQDAVKVVGQVPAIGRVETVP